MYNRNKNIDNKINIKAICTINKLIIQSENIIKENKAYTLKNFLA